MLGAEKKRKEVWMNSRALWSLFQRPPVELPEQLQIHPFTYQTSPTWLLFEEDTWFKKKSWRPLHLMFSNLLQLNLMVERSFLGFNSGIEGWLIKVLKWRRNCVCPKDTISVSMPNVMWWHWSRSVAVYRANVEFGKKGWKLNQKFKKSLTRNSIS